MFIFSRFLGIRIKKIFCKYVVLQFPVYVDNIMLSVLRQLQFSHIPPVGIKGIIGLTGMNGVFMIWTCSMKLMDGIKISVYIWI